MAPCMQPPANRLAQRPELSTGYDTTNNLQQPAVQPHTNLLNDSSNPSDSTSPYNNPAPLRTHVERVVREYFAALGDEVPTDLYELILKEVELPLLTVVLEQTRGNQTKCAQILGLNRGTLRKKLKTHNLMS